jgi:hypothetical protein
MSFLKDLFNHVSDQIETLTDDQNQPLIRWIDFDLGQLDAEKPSVSFPCALLTFGDAGDFMTLSDYSQQGRMTITIRYAFLQFERTHSKATPQYREQATAHLTTLERCHAKLQGTQGEGSFGILERTAIRTEHRADLRVYEVDYSVPVFPASPAQIEGDTEGGNFRNYIPWRTLPNHPDTPELEVQEDLVTTINP